MRRASCLAVLLLGAMLLSAPAQADGIDLKVKGEWDFAFGWANNVNFRNNRAGYRDDDNVIARQRFRTQIDFIASEYLQGVLMFEIGDIDWGHGGGNADSKVGPGSGGDLDADGVNVETRRAYVDWLIPNTPVSVRMGIQGVSLPMANGYCNPVFSADVAGIVLNSPLTDMIGVTAFWLRPFNRNLNDGVNDITGDPNSFNDEMDMFGLTLPVSGEGWSVTPWGIYSRIGNASGFYEYVADPDVDVNNRFEANAGANAWWAGVSAQVDMWDPLSFGFDVMYGNLSRADIDIANPFAAAGGSDFATKGWFVEAALNYTLDWGTPGVFGWYATGDDYDDARDGQFGRMPVLGLADDGFGPTSFGFPGGYNIGTDTLIGGSAVGTWGVGLQLADVSFVEDLSHTLRVAYYRGANDSDMIRRNGGNDDDIPYSGFESLYMTTKDYAWEVNFDHQCQIYENLTAVLELGYINLHLDSDTWTDHETDDAWKAQVLFRYEF